MLCLDCWKQWLQDTSEASSNAASPTSELSDLRTTGDGGKQSRSVNSIYAWSESSDKDGEDCH